MSTIFGYYEQTWIQVNKNDLVESSVLFLLYINNSVKVSIKRSILLRMPRRFTITVEDDEHAAILNVPTWPVSKCRRIH